MNPIVKRAVHRLLPRRLLVSSGVGDRAQVALTFDDGPHPDHTERILKVLRQERVKATFFLIGGEVEKYPALVKAMAWEGHALGNHAFSHRRLDQVPPAAWADEIERTTALIERAAGVSTRLFRPPYGAVTWPLLGYAWRRHWTIVLWSVDSGDSRAGASPDVVRDAVRSARARDIVLLHEDYSHTVEALGTIIRDVKARGLSCATVPQLMDGSR